MEGLTSAEANIRLKEVGLNKLEDKSPVSPWKIFFRQIRGNFLLYVLVAAAIISLLVDKHSTSYTIFGVIGIIIITSFIQEFKAEKAIKALEGMILPTTNVFRDGKIKEAPSSEIVPGDALSLKTGERIPADCIVMEETCLRVDESVLTGESKEIKKSIIVDNENNSNKLFMGTYITAGKCTAKVIATGMSTEFGKIAQLISATEKEMPLQKKVNKIAKYMAIIAFVASAFNGTVLLFGYESVNSTVLIEVLIVVIALSVSAIPEGLPLVLTTTLATGSYRMAKKNAVVNRMSVIETLGETTVICSDKTGTITKGEMNVTKAYFNNKTFNINEKSNHEIIQKDSEVFFKTAVLCNDAILEHEDKGTYKIFGSPTEKALILMGIQFNANKDNYTGKKTEEIPFSSERKKMSILYEDRGKSFVYAKGAAEIILDCCDRILINSKESELDKSQKENIHQKIKEFNDGGLRTIALAYKETSNNNPDTMEKELIFVGLAGIEDPPRAEVAEAIKTCEKAGITVKIITGDNLHTALAIAKQVGIEGEGIEGSALDELDDKELRSLVAKTNIFARVKPEQKLRIIKALKKNGEIVTMTGDGVNDAPALKESHIGVAMGKNGTDVTRGVADITLKDDNFSTIVLAIAEGRTIFGNIKRFVTYQLSINFAQLSIITLGSIFHLPLPLLALQVLFINLITDVIPSISIGLTPPHANVMNQKPRSNSDLIDKRSVTRILILGSVMVAGTLGVYYYFLRKTGWNIELSRTIALLTLIFFVVANSYNFRSLHTLVLKTSLFSNKFLIYSSIITLLGAYIITHAPLNKIFETTHLDSIYWITAGLLSLSIIVVSDFIKIFFNRYEKFKE